VKATATNVKEKIEAALKRSAEADADRISVECDDGRVSLRGTVRSWAEYNEAKDAAWAAPGVVTVNNQVVIDSRVHAAY
jgi:osmotically-inducible protein OsmY